MASYARARAIPTLWYRVDETDGDVATLFAYLRLAARQLKKGRARPLPLFTPEYRPGISAFTRRYFESLFERMATPGMIVFDNYQDVPETSLFHEVMRNGLKVVPEGIRVFVVSRKESPPSFVSLRANNGFASLSWEDVRLTRGEVREMLEQHRKTPLSEETVRDIHERTQGWAAAVILMSDPVWSTEVHRIGDSSVFDYFKTEIFDGLEQLTKDFLTITALLPSVSAGIASQLTQFEKSGELLAYLNRNNYFTELYQDEYRYHPLFRDFLLSEAESSLTPERMREVRCRAGKLFLDSGRTEEGITLLMAAQDWDSSVPALLAAAPGLVAEGRSQTLEGWIGSLPEEIRSESPRLLYWLAVCRQPYDPQGACLLFERSFTQCNEAGDVTGALLGWSGAVMSIFYGLMSTAYRDEQVLLLDPLIEWLDAFTAKGGTFPSSEIEATVAGSRMVALLTRPYHPEFKASIDRAFMLSRSVAGTSLRLEISHWAATCYMWLGDYGRWAIVVAELEKTANSQDPLQAICRRLIKAQALNQMGPFDQSPLPLLEEGLQMSAENGAIVWVPMLLAEGCHVALDRGDFRKASDFLVQMESMLGRAPKLFVQRYHMVSALYHLRSGDTHRAVAHAQQLLSFPPDEFGIFVAALGYCGSALVLAAAGRRDEAREHVAAFRRLPQTPSRIMEYTALIAEASLALDEGTPDARDTLRRAFRIGREEGYRTPLYCWIPSLMARLCSIALKAGIEVEYTRDLIRQRELFPYTPPLDIPHWPWPIRVFTLGRFEILVEDTPIDTTRLQKKPLLLLKALIALGGQGVTDETLSELLWPDAEGDAAYTSFRTTLSRLRRLLGSDKALLVHEGQVSLDPLRVWVDTAAFGRVFAQAELGKEDGASLARQAMELYRGDFLPLEEEHWVLSPRARLRDRFLRLMLALGGELEEKGRWDEACASYRAALDVDDLAEQLYQKLMICYSRLGDRAAAISAYTRLRNTLKAHLDVEPSAGTEALYRQVRAKTF